jgi:hypothetical protein
MIASSAYFPESRTIQWHQLRCVRFMLMRFASEARFSAGDSLPFIGLRYAGLTETGSP